MDTIARFWNNVEKTDSCWLWLRTTMKRKSYVRNYKTFVPEYGVFTYYNKRLSPTKMVSKTKLAHRYAWEVTNGPIPKGLCVLHKCDTPRCVNPEHLFLGTIAQNNADMAAKGRQHKPKGELNPKAKLNAAKVLEIRVLIANGASDKILADQYQVHPATIWHIRTRSTWQHI